MNDKWRDERQPGIDWKVGVESQLGSTPVISQ